MDFHEIISSDFLKSFIVWLAILIFRHRFWIFFASSVRNSAKFSKKKKKSYFTFFIHFAFLLFFIFLTIEDFHLYIKILKILPYSENGFWLTVLLPTLAMYFLVIFLFVGIIFSSRKGFLVIQSFREFKMFTFIIPLMKECFAFAYATNIGMLIGLLDLFLTIFHFKKFPRKLHKRKVTDSRKKV